MSTDPSQLTKSLSPGATPVSNFKLARTNWRQSIVFGLLWATFLAIHTTMILWFSGWQMVSSIAYLALLVFIGASIGGALGWFCTIWFTARRISQKRFAAALVLILLGTIGITAGLFALHYRLYYAQWHMATFSISWFFQFAFTSISAVYLFAVQGLRLLLPFGPLGLLIAAVAFVRFAPTNSQRI